MFCVKCGNKLDENEKFCTECGTKVNSGSSVNIEGVIDSVKETSSNIATSVKNTIEKDENLKNVAGKIKGDKRIFIGIAAVLVVIVMGSVAFFMTRSTPKKTLNNFVKAISDMDFEEAMEETNIMAMAQIEAGTSEAAATFVNKMISELMLEAQREGMSIDCKVLNYTPLVETKNMVTASVTMQMTVTSKSNTESDVQTEEFKFIKIDGEWKLDLADDFF